MTRMPGRSFELLGRVGQAVVALGGGGLLAGGAQRCRADPGVRLQAVVAVDRLRLVGEARCGASRRTASRPTGRP